MEAFKEIRQLGRGAFGVAVLVQDVAEAKLLRPSTSSSRCSRSELRVIKKIDLDGMELPERTKTLTEVKVLERFSHDNAHPNIVEYKEAFFGGSTLHVVMEYADGGDLARAIKKHREEQTSFGEENAFSAFAQCLQALKHIHASKILHRDIKPQNIFLTEAGSVKLGDFGIARICEHTQTAAQTTIGTPSYMAPEVCNNSPYDSRADIWSLGVVLYELLVLQQPFQAQNLCALVLKIVTGDPPPLPDEFTEQARDVINKTLAKQPEHRSSAEDLLNHLVVRRRVGETFRASHSSSGGVRPTTGRPHVGRLETSQTSTRVESASCRQFQETNPTAFCDDTNATIFHTGASAVDMSCPAGDHAVGTYSCTDSVDRLILDSTAVVPSANAAVGEEQLAEGRRFHEEEERRRTREIAQQAKLKVMGGATETSPFWTSADQSRQRNNRPTSGQASERPTSGQLGGSRPPSGQPSQRSPHGYLGDSALQSGGSLPSDFRQARRRQIPVTVHKQPLVSLGLDLDVGPNDSKITIEALKADGLLEAWNAERSFSNQIRPGDHIIEVNGVRGDTEKMLERLRVDNTLDLIIEENTDHRPDRAMSPQSRLDVIGVSSSRGMGSREASKTRLQSAGESQSLAPHPTPPSSRTPAASSSAVARRPRTGPAATPADGRSMLRTPPTSGTGASRKALRGAGLDLVGSTSRPTSQPSNSRPSSSSRQLVSTHSRPASSSRPNSRQGSSDPCRRVSSRGASPTSLRHQPNQGNVDAPLVTANDARRSKGQSPLASRSGAAVRESLLQDKAMGRMNSRESSASRLGGVAKVVSAPEAIGASAPIEGTTLPLEERFAWAAKLGNISLEEGRRFGDGSADQPLKNSKASCVDDLLEQIVRMEKTPINTDMPSEWGAVSAEKQVSVAKFASADGNDTLAKMTESWGGALMCESGTQLGRTGGGCGGVPLSASNDDTLSMLRQAING